MVVGTGKDIMYRYSKYALWRIEHCILVGEIDALLTTLINESLDLGRWVRKGYTVYFDNDEDGGVVSVRADPEEDRLRAVFTGACSSGQFMGKRVDRVTAKRIAKTCYY